MAKRRASPRPPDIGTREELLQALALASILEAQRQARPSDYLDPTPKQRQFLLAPHTVRVLATGNGFGKSTMMALDANERAMHTNRFQRTPDWPQTMIWVVRRKQTFGLHRPDLELDVLGSQATWRHTPDKGDHFAWPDGSFLAIAPVDRQTDWRRYQGINPDVVYFDENPPESMWREMGMRRRGRRDTKYVLGATQTVGRSWPKKVLYDPWVKWAREHGLTLEEMRDRQPHPDTFILDRGGHWDNPALTQAQHDWYESRVWPGGEREKRVRMNGGFEDWTSDGVFNFEAMERMAAQADEWEERHGAPMVGWLAAVLRGEPDPSRLV